MIYLFCGDDVKKKHASYKKFIKTVSAGTEVFFIGKNDFNKMEIESFYSGSGLFFTKCIVVFTNVFEKEDNLDFILEKLHLLDESNNTFIFLEGKLKKTTLEAFKEVLSSNKKALSAINIFELPKEKKELYDNFLLANAFGDRDKLNLWVHFRRAVDLGVGMEELVGVLFWKAKDLLIKKNFSKFSEIELKNFATRLSYLLPEARKKGIDAESVFEQFLLEAF
jgi:hypothetical protein